MATGTVKWFNETKGYGFIQPDQGGKDVFVHISAVERSGMRGLAEGQKVSYDVEADRRSGKETATNLRAAQRPALQTARMNVKPPCSGRILAPTHTSDKGSYHTARCSDRLRPLTASC